MEHYIIFTDGACQGNPGPGGWAAIIASPEGQVWELGGFEPATTNNRMELRATLEALRSIPRDTKAKSIHLYTDSQYVIQGITSWIHGWEARGWITKDGKPVSHGELWRELKAAADSAPVKIEWRYVAGHSAYPGNERCDRIAVGFTKGTNPHLFRGERKDYRVDLTSLPPITPFGKPPKSNGVPYYLSVIDGQIFRDKSWPECEARVKGLKGIKFKKVKDSEEETRTLTQWGIKNK